MAQSKTTDTEEFWLFHDVEESEIIEIRKYLGPELDLSCVADFMDIVDRLCHILE